MQFPGQFSAQINSHDSAGRQGRSLVLFGSTSVLQPHIALAAAVECHFSAIEFRIEILRASFRHLSTSESKSTPFAETQLPALSRPITS